MYPAADVSLSISKPIKFVTLLSQYIEHLALKIPVTIEYIGSSTIILPKRKKVIKEWFIKGCSETCFIF